MGKLDPELERLLHQRAPVGLRVARTATQPTVRVLVQFTGDLEVLRAAGLAVTVVVGSIAGGEIPLNKLPALASLPEAVRLESARQLPHELNVSVPEIRADLVHRDQPLGLRGTGVIVGIIDTGIDFRHGTFIRPDGTTRILRIWDQTLVAVAGESSPATTSVGVEYTNKHIDDVLAYERLSEEDRKKVPAPQPVRHEDEDKKYGHGTHVAGIAAGSGAPAGSCHGPFTYVGVAPDALLVVVLHRHQVITRPNRPYLEPTVGDSLDVLSAIEYVFDVAARMDPPRAAVINMSFGDNQGGHDGSGLLETALESYRDEPGRVVVKSAGNEGDSGVHAEGVVAVGASLPLKFRVPEFVPKPAVNPGEQEVYAPFEMEIWYGVLDRFDVSVTSPVGVTRGPVPAGSQQFQLFPDGNWVDIRSLTDSPLSDNRISLKFGGGTADAVTSGGWTITITGGVSVVNGAFHAWISKHNYQPLFEPPHRTDTHTITAPGTSAGVITVASYTSSGGLAESSSRGPTRDGRIKPDVAAPGQFITSARRHPQRWNCCLCCQDQYHPLAGTSMAAPHVTGVVALMLQRNPTITMTQVLGHLLATCRKDSDTGPLPVPDNRWGAGKITAYGAVVRVDPPIPAPPAVASVELGLPSGTGLLDDWRPGEWSQTLREILADERGAALADAVGRHADEVRWLINENLRVAAVWQRNAGPSLARAVIDVARMPDSRLPAVLDGRPVADRLALIGAALRRYGSPALVADLNRWESLIRELPGRSVRDLLHSEALTQP